MNNFVLTVQLDVHEMHGQGKLVTIEHTVPGIIIHDCVGVANLTDTGCFLLF